MAHDYEIGSTEAGLTNLGQLDTPVPAPKGAFIEHSRRVTLGDGTVRGLGWAEATWTWNNGLTREQRDQLKEFCAGASAPVYIRTRTNDEEDEYEYFTATMIWPEGEDNEWGWRRDFVIEFRNCQVYTPPE